MLKSIRIRNFALIDTLELEFSSGLNIFTGETGAGKSIILDALSMVLGEKADPSFVREGTRSASIEAVFDMGTGEVSALLEREDLLPDDGSSELTLARELRTEGRSTARVNGHAVSLGILQELGAHLVDIHGQSEHLSLLKPAAHIHLVDQFAGNTEQLNAYRTLYRRFLAVEKELRTLREGEAEALRTKDLLNWQINEIKEASLSAEEEESLLRERERLANAEKIAKHLREAIRALSGGNEDRPGIVDQMADLSSALESLAAYDDSLRPCADAVIDAADRMDGVLDKLRRTRSELGYSTRRRDHIEERLLLYASLKRKYGGTTPAVLAFGENAEKKLSLIESAAEQIPALETEREALLSDLTEASRRLSRSRAEASVRISADVEKELNDLRMPNARFSVRIDTPDGDETPDPSCFTENGIDTLEFLLAPNPGEGLKPLAKVASGGETSRIMLALKTALTNADPVPTLVFDEIDQGIGGRVGKVVGEKLWSLGGSHQVLCITHLPQLAALFDCHFCVRKSVRDQRTYSAVTVLTPEESLSELASLLGSDNEENRRAAEAMLRDARSYKDAFPRKDSI